MTINTISVVLLGIAGLISFSCVGAVIYSEIKHYRERQKQLERQKEEKFKEQLAKDYRTKELGEWVSKLQFNLDKRKRWQEILNKGN